MVRDLADVRSRRPARPRSCRDRQDHHHERPRGRLDRGRRPGDRARAVRASRPRARPGHHRPHRHPRQADLDPRQRAVSRVAALDPRDRPAVDGHHRRGRPGRHHRARRPQSGTSPSVAASYGSSATTSSSPPSARAAILRDIQQQFGASTLSEVRRFDDPAEAAATLAVREGDAAALGFYADSARIHVGDLGAVADQAYDAWAADRAAGLDSVLLAPTRELVSQLNARARADRLSTIADRGRSGSRPRRRQPGLGRRRHRHAPQQPPTRRSRAATGSRTATAGASSKSSQTAASSRGTSNSAAPSSCPPTTSPSTSSSATPPPSTAPRA